MLYIYIRIVEYAKVDGEKSSDKNLNFCISLQVRIFIPLFFLSLFDKGKKGKEKKKKENISFVRKFLRLDPSSWRREAFYIPVGEGKGISTWLWCIGSEIHQEIFERLDGIRASFTFESRRDEK